MTAVGQDSTKVAAALEMEDEGKGFVFSLKKLSWVVF